MLHDDIIQIESLNEKMKQAANSKDWSTLSKLAAEHNHSLKVLFAENVHQVNNKEWQGALLQVQALNDDLMSYIAKARQETLTSLWQLKEGKRATKAYESIS